MKKVVFILALVVLNSYSRDKETEIKEIQDQINSLKNIQGYRYCQTVNYRGPVELQCYKIIGSGTAPHPAFFAYPSDKIEELENKLAKLKSDF